MRSLILLALFYALPLVARAAAAQQDSLVPVVTVAGEAQDRIRLGQLTGAPDTSGFLLRSASRLNAIAPGARWAAQLLAPELRVVTNSGLPNSMNDDALWAGRGLNVALTAGFGARLGRVQIIVAPTYVSEANRPFQVIPYSQQTTPRRSQWANPFHPLPESIDLPLRFGDAPRSRVFPGQSSITADAGAVTAGFGTENRWWGPGIRNAIVLSSNAPGFAHAFVQTTRPLRTKAGYFDAQLIAGELHESDFFDFSADNDRRSVSGLALTWSPAGDRGLTLGAMRLVIARLGAGDNAARGAFDVFRSVGRPNADTSATEASSTRDQIFSLFARWVLAPAGFEAYAEWARFEEPASFRDFLEFPQHSQGYTLGLQWAKPLTNGTFRLQSEVSYLEPSTTFRLKRAFTGYTSRAVTQGFTERGEALGAAIGPGSSSQWIAADVFRERYRAGVFFGRVRWDDGALFEPSVPQFKAPDVSLFGGLRAGTTWRGVHALFEFTHTLRINYLFQGYLDNAAKEKKSGIDLSNTTLALTLSRGS